MLTKNLSALTIIYRPVSALVSRPTNARKHPKTQIKQIARSIQEFGFNNPVLVDENNIIIAGHGRVMAAKQLGMSQVPTVRVEGLTEEQIRAFVIADNRLAENAEWDNEILSLELQHLSVNDESVDVTLTGFEIAEIDLVIENAKGHSAEEPEFIQTDGAQSVTRNGDIWKLGKHRVLCGDALNNSCFKILMAGKKGHLALIDPPYNVPIHRHVSGNGSTRHREFAMASGEMSRSDFIAFLLSSFKLLARYSVANSIHFIFQDWRHLGELFAAAGEVYGEPLNLCVWAKNNAGLGSFYRSQHELICVFQNGKGKHQNNIQLGRFGRNRSNVWSYPNANSFSRQGEEGNLAAIHPTVKPIAMIADAILDCSSRGQLVIDSFLGSGTTLMAAERVGRICYGIEIDPLYVDVAIRRWQKLTGDHAVHTLTNQRFDDIAAAQEANHE